MKRKTKAHRYSEITREFQRRHPGPFTVDEVVDWALSKGLMPVPGRKTVELEAAAEWERRFAEIASEVVGVESGDG